MHASSRVPILTPAQRARPQNRNANGNGETLLPSTATVSSSSSGSSVRTNSSRGTGSRRLSSMLWRIIFVCGVFYVAVVWYSGMWNNLLTTPSPTDPKSSGQLSPQKLVTRNSRLTAAQRQEHSPLRSVVQPEPLALADHLDHELDDIVAAPESEPTIAHDESADLEPTPETATAAPRATNTPTAATTAVARYELLDEIKQQLAAMKRPAATQANIPAGAQPKGNAASAPVHSLSPREVFRARLMQGDALTAKEALALQAIDHAARLQKERDEQARAATLSPVDIAAQLAADEHAQTVKPMPRGETKRRRLKCIGWRATEDCDPMGKRKPSLDRSCVRFVDSKESGYCEVEDRDTGERFRVMRRQCTSLHALSRFRCFESWDFSNFAVLANDVVAAARTEQDAAHAQALLTAAPTAAPLNGILIVIYPKLIPSAFAIVRTLRSYNCSLPIEFWYRTDELNVAEHPTLQAIAASYGPVVFRSIEDQRATGFATKIAAIQHSRFDNVLFLDADNFPVKDPTYLFALPEFRRDGAVFWPDFWHPDHTIFNIHNASLLWELVDMDFVDMFEQESGQLLIDRHRSAVALALMQFYTFHRPNHFDKFRLAHGDKDLFRLAWLKTNTSFHFVQHPPGVAGKLQHGLFCGMTMVQRDPSGDVLFLHRNAKKLTGRKFNFADQQDAAAARAQAQPQMEAEDPAVWTHMLLFKPTSQRADFEIDIFEGAPAFPVGQWCYGKRTPATPHFNVFEFDKLPYAELETRIRVYAVEATEMVRAATLRAAARAAAMRDATGAAYE